MKKPYPEPDMERPSTTPKPEYGWTDVRTPTDGYIDGQSTEHNPLSLFNIEQVAKDPPFSHLPFLITGVSFSFSLIFPEVQNRGKMSFRHNL